MLTQNKLISFVFFMSFININIVYVLQKPSREILIFSIINFNYKICVFLYCSLVGLNTKKFKLKKNELCLLLIVLHACQFLFP